jgi:hypothetical protein
MVRAVTAYLRDEARAGRPVNALLAGLLRAAAFDRDNAYAREDGAGGDAAGRQLRSLYSIVAAEQAAKREVRADDSDDLSAELAAIFGSGPTMGDTA